MRLLLTVLFTVCAALGQEPGPQSPAPDDHAWIQKEVGLEQMFRNPPAQFKALTFHRVDRIKVNGEEKVRYSISAAGLDPAVDYILMAWELGAAAPNAMLRGVRIGKDGVLHCGPKTANCPGKGGSDVNVAVGDNSGQPSHFVVASEDEQPLALGEVIPSPNSVTDHGCTLDTVLLRTDATVTLVIGSGFMPGEAIQGVISSGDEHVNIDGKANESGEYHTAVLPLSKESKSGDTVVSMHSSRCELTTEFHWGASATPPPAPDAPPQSPPS